MNKEEFEILNDVRPARELITIDDLGDKSDRTLLFGFTPQRETWHVYIMDGEIIIALYNRPSGRDPERIRPTSNEDYVPHKRLYPERCDFEFCFLLMRKGVSLPFTLWTDGIEEKKYYGETLLFPY
jgi:hypothetical protein